MELQRFNNNNNKKCILRGKMQKQTQRRGSLHIGKKRMTSILRHVAEAFTTARQRTILSSYRVIGIATDSDLHNDITADVGLPDAV